MLHSRSGVRQKHKGVLEFSDEPLVSEDIVGNPHSCILIAS